MIEWKPVTNWDEVPLGSLISWAPDGGPHAGWYKKDRVYCYYDGFEEDDEEHHGDIRIIGYVWSHSKQMYVSDAHGTEYIDPEEDGPWLYSIDDNESEPYNPDQEPEDDCL